MTLTDPHARPAPSAVPGGSGPPPSSGSGAPGLLRGGTRSAVAVVAVVVLVAAGSFVWWRHWGPGHHSVAVLGDSITAFSSGALESGLGFRYDARVDGVPGARTDERVAQAQAMGAAGPQDVVINLGTNDVLQNWDLEASMAALDQIGASFAGASCIIVTDVSESMAKPDDPGVRDRAVAFNARLRQVATARGWHLIEWSRIVADDVAQGQPDGAITLDTIHPSEHGQELLVSATYDALAGC